MRSRRRWVFIAPLAIVGMLVFTVLGGTIVQQLWNWLLPALFEWPRIGFWQALAMLALCRILFGGLGLRGSSRSHFRRRWAERWDAMTPEERERLRHGMRDRWGFGPPAGEGKES